MKILCTSAGLALSLSLLGADYLKQARVLEEKKDFVGALAEYKKALPSLPNHADLHAKIAALSFNTDQFRDAVFYFDRAFSLNQTAPMLLIYKAQALEALGALEEASKIYEKLYTFNSVVAAANHPLWCHYMRHENFKAIAALWPYAASPWNKSDINGKIIVWKIPPHAWGAGDIFMRIRYAQQLKTHGARIIVVCKPALVPLLSLCPFVEKVIAYGDPVPLHDLAYDCGREEDTLFAEKYCAMPETKPYLFAHPQLCTVWQKRLARDHSFKIGICWQSQPVMKIDKKIIPSPRSLDLALLAPIAEIPHVTLYSLQKSFGTHQLHNNAFAVRIFDELDTRFGAFMDTAALMKNLDLVITVDTSIAHLAGALGVPVWVMLPQNSDFRWFTNRSDSPWYHTMKLFRQTEQGNWMPVINAMVDELKKLDTLNAIHS